MLLEPYQLQPGFAYTCLSFHCSAQDDSKCSCLQEHIRGDIPSVKLTDNFFAIEPLKLKLYLIIVGVTLCIHIIRFFLGVMLLACTVISHSKAVFTILFVRNAGYSNQLKQNTLRVSAQLGAG